MIDFEKLKKELNSTNTFTKYDGATIYNGNLVYYGGEAETYPMSIAEEGGKIVLTDIGVTIDRLYKQDIDIQDEDVSVYVNKVLDTLGVAIGPSQELTVYANNEKDCPYAMGRLYQAIILLSYIDLQYEDEE